MEGRIKPTLRDFIVLWLDSQYQLGVPASHPDIIALPQAELVARRYGSGTLVTPGDIVVLYDKETRAILVSDGCTGGSFAELSILVHEMVHHLLFTLTFENNIFVNEDDGYTNGLGFTYGRGPFRSFNRENTAHPLFALSHRSYINTMPNKVRGVAYMFFQRMQTPREITVMELQENDIPYTSLIALQSTLYA